MTLSFFIPGIPRPGGSKKAWVPRRKDGSLVLRHNGSPAVVITDDAKGNREWKQQCAVFARQHYKGPPLLCELRVTFAFFRTRPKAHFTSKGQLKDSVKHLRPITKPDLTKLIRAAEDALTGICWGDDASIVEQVASKSYSDTSGLQITIESLTDPIPLLAEDFGLGMDENLVLGGRIHDDSKSSLP